MADYVFKVSLPFAPDPDLVNSAKPRESLVKIGRMLGRIASGSIPGASTVVCDTGTSGATAASGTVTLSTASGTVGATINGVAVTTAASGGDTATAAALAAAINAESNALVANHVTATSAAGVVTITARMPGQYGNAITLAASGTGATASGARLTGGAATRTTLSF